MTQDVDPQAYFRSSTSMRFSGNTVSGALDVLKGSLAGSGGMAGSDDTGKEFGGGYDPAAADLLASVAGLADMAINAAEILRASGLNHQNAEHASTVGGPPPEAVPIPENPATAVPTIPSAYGYGGNEPTGAIATAWQYIQKFVGYIWPDGDSDKLEAAARAWNTAATTIRNAGTSVDWAKDDIAAQVSPEIPAATAHLSDLKGKIDSIAGACNNVETSCNNLSQAIKDAHDQLIEALSEFANEFVVGEIIFGVLFEVGGELWGNAAMAARAAVIAERCARIIEKLIDLARAAARIAKTAVESIANIVKNIKGVVAALAKRAGPISQETITAAEQIGKDVSVLSRGTRASTLAERLTGLHLSQEEAAQATNIAAKAAFGETAGIARLPDGTMLVLPARIDQQIAMQIAPDGSVTVLKGYDLHQFLPYLG